MLDEELMVPPDPPLAVDSSLLDFCKSVFSGSLWPNNPKVFHTLLALESPDIYYVYECVEEHRRIPFLGYLLRTVSDQLTAQMGTFSLFVQQSGPATYPLL
ncbi:hypothetical protein COOONC_21418 [Cooperia oncophora]